MAFWHYGVLVITPQSHKATKPIIKMSAIDKQALIARVDKALDDVRPHLKVDGGNVEVVDITDDLVLQIKWIGNCESCSMSAMTMRAGVEQTVKGQVPEIVSVEAVNGVTIE